MRAVRVSDSVSFGGGRFGLIAGPCLIEDVPSTAEIACHLRDLARELGIDFVFKASCDKANRTSVASERGPGWHAALDTLAEVKSCVGVPVLTDVHEVWQVESAAGVCDMLQVPAFLCRQTDLLVAAGRTGLPVNIKKGQFLSPGEMRYPVGKVSSTGNQRIAVTERGFSFGYGNLVVDMRGFPIMSQLGYPVLFDATHSVQLPGGADGASGGQREFVAPLALAAIAAGADGLFIETHPAPDNAPCDGANMVPLGDLPALLRRAVGVFAAARAQVGGGTTCD